MRIKYLDGIKGLGAIGVFLCHYNMFNFPSPSCFHDTWLSKWFMSGGYAVAMFLIVSGFSALLSVKRKLDNNVAISKVIVNRYFRFAIPFGLTFIILYITNFFGLYSFHIQAGESLNSESLKNAFWSVNIVGFIKSLLLSPINSDFWDAPLWMMKYVFLSTYIALLIALSTRVVDNTKKYIIIASFILILSTLDIFFYGVMFGIMLSYVYIDKNNVLIQCSMKVKCFTGICCLAFAILTRYYLKGSVEFVNITSAAFLLIGINYIQSLQKILECSILQYLGKISFGIFLWHWPIMCSLTSFLYVRTFDTAPMTSICCTLIPTFIAVIVVSHISEKYLESGISNYIIKKISDIIYIK